MTYQRLIFAGLAAAYCVFLGIFALWHNRHARLNQLFAGFNFCNALWNLDEFVVFIPDLRTGVWVLKVLGIGGSFLTTFFLAFGYTLTGLSNEKWAKIVVRTFFILGSIFAAAHFTPLIYSSIAYSPFVPQSIDRVPGSFYPLFAVYLLAALVLVVVQFPHQIMTTTGIRRLQMWYVALASCLGFIALLFYYESFFSLDIEVLPIVCTGNQCL